jgi:hypothetical protein
MSILEGALTSAKGKDPLIMTICGDAGSGKTSLAATFPNAFIIRTQGEAMPRDINDDNAPVGLAPIGGKRIKQGDTDIWDESELFDQLMALLRDEHQYKTLIVDSVTGIENLFVTNIIDVQPTKQKTMNAAGSGFGSAWDIVAGKHGRIKKAAELLRDRKGMNIIFIAHVDVNRIDPPESEAYTRYELQLHKKTAPIYINNVDVVGCLKQETFIMEGGKAKTSGERVLSVAMTPANVSKNRLGITSDIPVKKGENPFKEFI